MRHVGPCYRMFFSIVVAPPSTEMVGMCIFTGKNSQHSWESIQSLVNLCRILPKCHNICDVTTATSCKGERAQVQESKKTVVFIIPTHLAIHFLLMAAPESPVLPPNPYSMMQNSSRISALSIWIQISDMRVENIPLTSHRVEILTCGGPWQRSVPSKCVLQRWSVFHTQSL